MGCKESKHIATDNTIITPTSSTKSTNPGQDDNDKNNAQTLQRSRSGRSPMQKQKSLKENNVGDSKAADVLNENKKSGDDKGAENEKEGRKLKESNDQVVEGDKELIKENAKVSDEAIIKKKEDENGNVGDNGGKESFLIPKEDLPSTSTKNGESIEAINTDGASVYSTPTEVAGAFDNTKTENAEEKKEPVEETEDTKTEEATAKENLTRIVDSNPDNYVREAEVDEKIKEAEAAVATPENHLREGEVEEKIKDAEAAVESLEKLVTIKYPVKETEEISAKEVEATNSSIQYPEKEADKSEEIVETQVAATDATPQNPVEQTDKSEESPVIETKATDATLKNAVTESDKTKENLIKESGEAVENGVKEIHEVTSKAGEIPVKAVETSHEAKQENQALVAEEVLENKVEADKVEENLVTSAEAANTAVKNLESAAKVQSQEQDAANTEEDTKSSSTTNERQISKEDPDVQKKPEDFEKQ